LDCIPVDKIEHATEDALNSIFNNVLNCDVNCDECDANDSLVEFVINNSRRDDQGRLVMPALWNPELIHLLPNNYKLAHNILNSLFKKFNRCPSKLNQYDAIIKQQLEDGVIERVQHFERVKHDSTCSFIAHNAVYKESSATTKCRIVLLSNLCDGGTANLSHNQVSVPGPNLNSKLYISLMLLRFNEFLFTYDITKAYLQLKI